MNRETIFRNPKNFCDGIEASAAFDTMKVLNFQNQMIDSMQTDAKELSKNKMIHLTCAKSPKIDDQKWGCILVNTAPFLIVDFRLIWRGEMVHFIFRQLLKQV